MTIIEQIKAEIERRQKENFKQKGSFAAGRVVEDADILSFISTIESEKPMNQEGLEEEISKKYANDNTTMRTREQYAELARHFAQWGAEHLADARKTSPKDLEEAAKRYGNNKHPMTPTGARESQEDFIAGAKWDREQIMKNAKEGWIDEENVIILSDGTRIDLQPDYDKKPAFEFEYAQDVRVIVLPKEDSYDTGRKR